MTGDPGSSGVKDCTAVYFITNGSQLSAKLNFSGINVAKHISDHFLVWFLVTQSLKHLECIYKLGMHFSFLSSERYFRFN